MSEMLLFVTCLIVLFVALPLVILWSKDCISAAISHRRNSPENLANERRAYEQRILSPDWDFYERHLQRAAPIALRELFSDRALVTAQDIAFGEDDSISTFDPLDKKGLEETQPWLDFEALAIATSDAGDPIYLRPGPLEADVVYVTRHDGGDAEIFARSVEVMVQKLKVKKKNA